MRAAVLMALVPLVGTQAADARHYRFHYRYGDAKGAHTLRDPGPNALQPRLGAAPRYSSSGAHSRLRTGNCSRSMLTRTGEGMYPLTGLPRSCSMRAQRTGYSASDHLKAVAFVNGERVLTLAGTQNELLVTGTKDHRTFMRKTDLASV
jgi:hypothetical protein